MVGLVTAVSVLTIVAIALTVRDDDSSTATDGTTSTVAVTTTSQLMTTAAISASTTATTGSTETTVSSTAASTTSSSATPSTTEPSSSTSSTPTTAPVDATALWPWTQTDTRYDDPLAAALGFATEFVGFENATAGPYRAGDSRSGEVEIRASADGPGTIVFVRQLGADDTWWVLGSATENIVVDEPDALSTIEDPVAVTGEGRAFEGVIEVQVRADGQAKPIGTGTVLASSTVEPGPFEGSISWTETSAERGAVVFLTRRARDGEISEATVIRVELKHS